MKSAIGETVHSYDGQSRIRKVRMNNHHKTKQKMAAYRAFPPKIHAKEAKEDKKREESRQQAFNKMRHPRFRAFISKRQQFKMMCDRAASSVHSRLLPAHGFILWSLQLIYLLLIQLASIKFECCDGMWLEQLLTQTVNGRMFDHTADHFN